MYNIIGADGAQYGPITVEQLRQWIAEGRVNAQTLVQPAGRTDWKPLSEYPELASLVPPEPLPSTLGPTSPPVYSVDASRQVQGPAIGLILTAVLGLMGALGNMGFHAFYRLAPVPHGPSRGNGLEQLLSYSAGGLGMLQGLVQLAVGILILVGAIKMLKLQQYTFAVIAAVLALIPCVSPCCLIGLPIGIWALTVLSRPEVKALFP